jgi:hypothetical protein
MLAQLDAVDSGSQLATLSFASISPFASGRQSPLAFNALQSDSSLLIRVERPTAIKTQRQPRQSIKFNCAARDDFSNGTWEVWRVNGLDWEHVWSKRIGSITRHRSVPGAWNGQQDDGSVSAGDHALQLTAWWGRESDGSWVIAHAVPTLVVE